MQLLVVVLVLSYWIGLLVFHSSDRNPLITLLVGLVVFAVASFLIAQIVKLYSRFSAYKKSWAECQHGIQGGIERHLCDKCTEERRMIAEADQRRLEAEQRQRQTRKFAAELRLQEASRLAQSLIPSVDELRKLSPSAFEDEIARMFERLGYTVMQTPYSNDHGRDAILHKNGEKFLLECKRYREGGACGRPELQKFHSAIVSDRARRGFFITTGRFSKGAREFAKTVPIDLVDGSQLLKFMYDSKCDASQDDVYESMCAECGDLVQHRLRNPREEKCRYRHPVRPTLTIEDVLTTSSYSIPNCAKCGVPMRLVRGKNGSFWGCSGYPKCRSSRPYRGGK